MTLVQNQKLKMYMALRTLFAASMEILAKIPNIDEFITSLDQIITDIQEDEKNKTTTKPLTKAKRELRTTLNDNMLDVTKKMKVFADDSNDPVLKSKLIYNKTNLKSFRETEIVNEASKLYDLVQTSIDQLVNYGLDAATQITLSTNKTNYENAIPETDKGKQDSKNSTDKLNADFSQADQIIEDFDLRIELLKFSHPTFYNDYKDLRKLIIVRKRLALKATITDGETGAAIPNVKAVFSLEGEQSIEKNSTKLGAFQIKSMNPGIYTATFSKIGYQTQTKTITLPGDDTYLLDVKMLN